MAPCINSFNDIELLVDSQRAKGFIYDRMFGDDYDNRWIVTIMHKLSMTIECKGCCATVYRFVVFQSDCDSATEVWLACLKCGNCRSL